MTDAYQPGAGLSNISDVTSVAPPQPPSDQTQARAQVRPPMAPPQRLAYIGPQVGDYLDPTSWNKPDFHANRGYPGVDPSPYMPQSSQIPGLVPRMGGFFSQYGSMPVAANATAMNYYWAAFLKARMAAQHQMADDYMRRYAFQRDQMLDRTQDEINEVGEIFALNFDKDAKWSSKDPNKLQAALIDYANRSNNPGLAQAASTSLAQVQALLAAKKAELTNGQRISAQQTKQADEEREAQRWGTAGAQQQPQGPTLVPGVPGLDPSLGTVAPSPLPDISGAQPPATAAGAQPQPSAAASQPTPDPNGDANGNPQAPPNDMTDPQALARWALQGGSLEGVNKDTADQARQIQSNLLRRLQGIELSGKTGQDLYNAVRQTDGPTAALMEDIRDNVKEVPQGARYASPFWSLMTGLTHRAFPGWIPQQYEARAASLKQFTEPSGRPNIIISKANVGADSLHAIIKAVRALPPAAQSGPAWDRFVAKIKANVFSADPTYTGLQTAIQNYTANTAALAAGTGTTRVTTQSEMLANLKATSSAPQLLETVLLDAGQAGAELDSVHQQWDQQFGNVSKDPPFWPKDAYDDFKAAARMNPYTLTIDGYVPRGLRDLVNDPIPPLNQREDNKVYTTARGKLRWHAGPNGGWEKVQ